MTDPWDEFFIDKINQGLSASSQHLTLKEEELLCTPVEKLGESPDFSPEGAQQLQAKCIGALTEAYTQDTAGKNRQAALLWRENNGSLYKYSKLVISGIVQNWYLRVGRAQEKRASGCFAIIAAFVIVTAILVVTTGLLNW